MVDIKYLLTYVVTYYISCEFFFKPLNETFGKYTSLTLLILFLVGAFVIDSIRHGEGPELAKISAIFLYLAAAFFIYFHSPFISVLMMAAASMVLIWHEWRSLSIEDKEKE